MIISSFVVAPVSADEISQLKEMIMQMNEDHKAQIKMLETIRTDKEFDCTELLQKLMHIQIVAIMLLCFALKEQKKVARVE